MMKLPIVGGGRNAARLSAIVGHVVAAAALLVLTATAAIAQPQAPATPTTEDDWKVGIYPIFAWVPLASTSMWKCRPLEGGGGGGAGAIVDGRFDGAFLGGFSAAKGLFRVDGDGLWAAVGGDRPEQPFLRVDVDADLLPPHGRREGGQETCTSPAESAGWLSSTTSRWAICQSSSGSRASGIRWWGSVGTATTTSSKCTRHSKAAGSAWALMSSTPGRSVWTGNRSRTSG